jgi:hypothetical protein
MREIGNPSVQGPKVTTHPTTVRKRYNAAKSWIVLCNSGAFALAAGKIRNEKRSLNFSMIAAFIALSLQ